MIVNEKKVKDGEIPWAIINKYNEGDNIAPGPRIRARCKVYPFLFYRYNRVREGEEFFIYPVYVASKDSKTQKVKMKNGQTDLRIKTAKEQFNEETMEFIEEGENIGGFERFSTSQQALDQKTNELIEEKRGPGRPPKDA